MHAQLPGHAGLVEALAFSPDGRTLASGSADGTVRLWDVVRGEAGPVLSTAEDKPVGALAFSPDGRWLVFGDYGGRVAFHGLKGETVPSTPSCWGEQGRIVGMGFTAEARLAWASYTAVRECLPGGSKVTLLQQGPPRPFSLAVSPTAGLIAVGYQSPQVTLHDAQGGFKRTELTHGKERGCWGMSFSPDGKVLALALGEGAQLWDVEGRRLAAELDGHTDVVTGAACSPDGSRLLTCSWDGTVRQYDVSGGGRPALLQAFDWRLGRLFCVAFSPDGTLAAAGGDQGDFLLAWDVE